MIQNDPENSVREEQQEKNEEVVRTENPMDEISDSSLIEENLTEESVVNSTNKVENSPDEEFFEEVEEEIISDEKVVIDDEYFPEDNDEDGSDDEEDFLNEFLEEIEEEILPDIEALEDVIDDSLPPVDYSGYSKKDLVETLTLLVENRYPSEIKNDVDRLKGLFYKKLKQEEEERKKEFLESGGKIEEYRLWVDPDEAQVKLMLEKYKAKRTKHSKVQDAEKEENLKKKYDIIDKIKDLVNREESINKTFQEFRSLQNEWYNIGVVPQSALKNMWENYHHSVELFYSYIKINKELRDLDLKKNQELKVQMCEKAEALINEPNPISAFRILQEFHNQWREIGPTPQESKDKLWERFKEATAQVNKRHHAYFEKQKEEQKKNLDLKSALCEEVETFNKSEIKSLKEFDAKADKIVELQKRWRTIGFAPKKQNNKIYKRFREACDAFFEKRRLFYASNKDSQLKNLQMKLDLCAKAEALQESSDWKITSDALVKLQKEWKEIGPAPRKHSEKCWKRFRKACDHFFNRKTAFFNNLDNSYDGNLKAKLEIIGELEQLSSESNTKAVFEKLKDIQKRWNEIGFVPFDKKEEIANRYKKTLNNQLNKLKVGEEVRSILQYETKLDSLKSNPKASKKLRIEREKFITQIKQLESEIVVWENNKNFFAKSAKADSMIKSVEEKIKNAKILVKTLEGKVRIIDQSGLDD